MLTFFLKREVWATIVIVIIGILLYFILKSIINKILKHNKHSNNKRKATIVGLIQNIIKYIMLVLIILICLDLYGINVKALIAGLGILTLVLGLALQDTIKDFIGGITIIFDDYYSIGDYINYNNFIGEVIEFGLRSTKIKSYNGEIKVFTNRSVTEIINYSKEKSTTFIDIPIAYEEDVLKVEKTIQTIILRAKTNKNWKISNLEYLGIEKFDSSAMLFRLSLTCSYQQSFQYKRLINYLIKHEFDKEKIKIPYNQIEVHNAK